VFRSYLDCRIFKTGEVLMNDGESGDFMGFVLDGKLAVKKETSFPGRFIMLAILERGAMIGENSAVERGSHTAMVVAIQESKLLLLTFDRMEKLLTEYPELGMKLLKRIVHVLSLRQLQVYGRLSSLL
ncbi:MAG: cyclic nucleotide-binding domain-containing protein, partial [Desulfobulbaceae bacterium]|nr:cyclic nucleotide-binding domain-containing protein [Desulfobulbaceae bacterium]